MSVFGRSRIATGAAQRATNKRSRSPDSRGPLTCRVREEKLRPPTPGCQPRLSSNFVRGAPPQVWGRVGKLLHIRKLWVRCLLAVHSSTRLRLKLKTQKSAIAGLPATSNRRKQPMVHAIASSFSKIGLGGVNLPGHLVFLGWPGVGDCSGKLRSETCTVVWVEHRYKEQHRY
jgi:hypothetical protein